MTLICKIDDGGFAVISSIAVGYGILIANLIGLWIIPILFVINVTN